MPLFCESTQWELQKKGHLAPKVVLYYRDYPGSKTPEFKAVTTISTSMASILAVLLDTNACNEWIHQCKKSFPIRVINPMEQYIYQINQLPFVKDRDIILHTTLNFFKEAKKILITLNATPDFCNKTSPTRPENCNQIDLSRYVHVTKATGYYELLELNDQIQITWQQHIEAGGLLPNWLAKSQLSDLPIKTLTALHEMVNREKYKNATLTAHDQTLQIINKPYKQNP